MRLNVVIRKKILVLLSSPLTWIIIAGLLLYQFVVVPYWKPSWDSATYITIAQSLVQGDGYMYNGYPHIKYPPGFPLLLAPIVLLFGQHFYLMRLLIVFCAVGSIGLTYLLLSERDDKTVAITVSLLTGTSYALLFEATRILSDVPYMLASIAVLVIAGRYQEHRTRRWLATTVTLIVVASSVRVIGFVLAPAVALSLCLDSSCGPARTRIRQAIVILGITAIVLGAWIGRNALVKEHLPTELREALSYERELVVTNPNDPYSATISWEALCDRLGKNVVYYEQLLGNLLTSNHAQNPNLVHILGTWWMFGWGLALVRRRSSTEFYTLFYVIIYLLWPSHQGERFLVPILPMLFYYTLYPLLLFFDWGKQVEQMICQSVSHEAMQQKLFFGLPSLGHVVPFARLVVFGGITLFCLHLGTPGLRTIIRTERSTPYYQGAVASYIHAIEWVRDHTSSDAVIITDRAPWAHLLAERRAFTSPWVENHAEVLTSIEHNRGTHVIDNNEGISHQFLTPVIKSRPNRFVPIHKVGTSVIYEFVPVTNSQ